MRQRVRMILEYQTLHGAPEHPQVHGHRWGQLLPGQQHRGKKLEFKESIYKQWLLGCSSGLSNVLVHEIQTKFVSMCR